MILIHELILCLLLGVNVSKADIVDSEFKVLTVLHDSHRISLHVELVGERALELLLVSNEYAVSEDAPLARQLAGQYFNCRHLSV